MCGIVGIVDAGGVSFPLYYALYALQHRGQESAGISTFHEAKLLKHSGPGLVAEVFCEDILAGLAGTVGIGHVRYPTTGAKTPENIQPFNFRFKGMHLAIAHNGNLVNTRELRAEYEQQGKIFCTTTDTEVIANVIADEVRTSDHLEDAVLLCMRRLQGSYSVVLMVNDTLYAFRDPLGIKPLCIGRTEHGHIVASESVAMDALGAEFIRDVKPGEMIRIDADGIECAQIAVANHRAHCIFEYVYFARADSVIDGTLVYDVRRCIGRKLHENDLLEADIVSPVPDSGTAYAVGYAEASGMPFLEGLMKNRYMGRTFIMPTQRQRENAVRIKLNPIRSNILEKKVVLIDDSIVRGTTSRRIVDMIREAGAAEVHVRVGSPPIIAPCYLGVDMPTREELIASGRGEEAVRESISATTLNYVSLDALVEAIGIDAADLCTGCLTGYYPLSISGERCCPRVIDFVGGTYQSNLESFGPDQAGSSGDSLQYTTIAGKWVQNE